MILKRSVFTFWFWSLILITGLFASPFGANTTIKYWRVTHRDNVIAPFFTEQVQYWENDIARWSTAYGVDANLMATIMQIESCGHPTVVSHAGAQGLFQVMPFHFDPGDDMLDPYANAFRSANFIRECSTYANGDVGLILACYNGGPSVVYRSFDTWANETQRYYVWGLTMYRDAVTFTDHSPILDEWLRAGGVNLCNSASVALGLGHRR